MLALSLMSKCSSAYLGISVVLGKIGDDSDGIFGYLHHTFYTVVL